MANLRWNINGVKFIDNGKIKDSISQDDVDNIPNSLGIITGESTTEILIKIANLLRTMGIENHGGFLGIGIDGRNVAQNMTDCSFVVTDATENNPYSGFISSSPSTMAYNIIPTQRPIIKSNYILKNSNTEAYYKLSRTTTIIGNDIINCSPNSLEGQSYGWLSIDDEGDPLTNNADLAGSVNAIKFKIYPTENIPLNSAPISPYSLQLYECNSTIQRPANIFKFYIDSPLAPTIVSASITSITQNLTTTYFSGIPRYKAGSTVNIRVIANHILNQFYNYQGTFAIVNSQTLNNARYILSNSEVQTIYAQNVATNATINFTTTYKSNAYGNLAGTLYAYSTKSSIYNDASCTHATNTVTVDTNSVVESSIRVSSNDLGAYDSTQLLTANYELQFQYNRFIYPTYNYSGDIPSGPNYSLCIGDGNNMRWLTIKQTQTTDTISRGQIIITGVSADINTILPTDLKIEIKFNNAGNWLDARILFAFDGANEETNGIYNSQNLTYTVNVTCGESLTANNVYVRIGLKHLSTFSFERLTFVFVCE